MLSFSKRLNMTENKSRNGFRDQLEASSSPVWWGGPMTLGTRGDGRWGQKRVEGADNQIKSGMNKWKLNRQLECVKWAQLFEYIFMLKPYSIFKSNKHGIMRMVIWCPILCGTSFFFLLESIQCVIMWEPWHVASSSQGWHLEEEHSEIVTLIFTPSGNFKWPTEVTWKACETVVRIKTSTFVLWQC